MRAQIRMLLQEQSDLNLYCLSKRRLNISAGDNSSRLLLDNGALKIT